MSEIFEGGTVVTVDSASVIDVSGAKLMPGFIDRHTHTNFVPDEIVDRFNVYAMHDAQVATLDGKGADAVPALG